MKILFFAFLITYCLAVFYAFIFIGYLIENGIDFEIKSIRDFILKILFPILSFTLVITSMIFTFKIGILAFILFFLINFFLIMAFIGWGMAIFEYDYEGFILGILSSIIFLVLLILFSLCTIDKNTSKSTITVPLYNCSNSSNRESILLKITDEDDVNLYIAMEYDKNDTKDIELPVKLSELSEFKITKDSNNEIVIKIKTITKISTLSYFGFIEPSEAYEYEYDLYINEDCIENLGSN